MEQEPIVVCAALFQIFSNGKDMFMRNQRKVLSMCCLLVLFSLCSLSLAAAQNGPPPANSPDFTISGNTGSVAVIQGNTSLSGVTVSSLNGFNSTVSLSIAGVPNGVTATFLPTSLTPASGGSASSTLELQVFSSAVPGNYTLTVTGVSGSISHSFSFRLSAIQAPPPCCIGSANFQFGLPNEVNIVVGNTSFTTITVTSESGFSAPVNLSISGLPSGVTAKFLPASVTPPDGGSTVSTLDLDVSSSATPGTYTLTIVGVSGSISNSASLTLNILE